MKAFYGSRFSTNMTRTPEGYLICHNVPIARIGDQQYLGQELGQTEKYDQIITVHRTPEEVFDKATLASFEGKPVTDNHPREDVRPDNYNSYMKGICTNVRRGTGDESDFIVADLIIYDPILQSEIEAGKREVSCGYDCNYEENEDGSFDQRQILGNHVAVVTNGRAGNRVAIKDNNIERSKEQMSKQPSIFAKMLSAFAKDASPEELLEASKAVNDKAKDEDGTEEQKKETAQDAEVGGTGLEELSAKMDQCMEMCKKCMEMCSPAAEEPADALDALEGELGGEAAKEESTQDFEISLKDAAGEESVTVEPEAITADEDGCGEEEKKEDTKTTDSLLQVVKAIKPVVASIKDPAERKRVSDALAKTFRGQMATSQTQDKGYAGILDAVQKNAVAKVKDGQPKSDNSDYVDKCAERNPHYKGGKR